MIDNILEPRKRYLYELEREHLLNTEEYFDDLAKKSGIDIDANRRTCADYYATKKEIDALTKQGFIRTSLGKRILRAETAAIYALSVIGYLLENEKPL